MRDRERERAARFRELENSCARKMEPRADAELVDGGEMVDPPFLSFFLPLTSSDKIFPLLAGEREEFLSPEQPSPVSLSHAAHTLLHAFPGKKTLPRTPWKSGREARNGTGVGQTVLRAFPRLGRTQQLFCHRIPALQPTNDIVILGLMLETHAKNPPSFADTSFTACKKMATPHTNTHRHNAYYLRKKTAVCCCATHRNFSFPFTFFSQLFFFLFLLLHRHFTLTYFRLLPLLHAHTFALLSTFPTRLPLLLFSSFANLIFTLFFFALSLRFNFYFHKHFYFPGFQVKLSILYRVLLCWCYVKGFLSFAYHFTHFPLSRFWRVVNYKCFFFHLPPRGLFD